MIYKLLLPILLPFSAHAAFEFQPIGAHASGAGDVGVAMASGASGMFWNPAAIAWGDRISLFGGYDRPLGMYELATQALGVAVRMGRQGVGIRYTVSCYGYCLSLCCARELGFSLNG